ncbi:hypothetical protein ACFL3G_03955 [Planctomycetota bacterium]
MCCIPNFEEMELDMDKTLLSLFWQWKFFTLEWVTEEEMGDMDSIIKNFLSQMQSRLIDLQKEGKLDKPTED